MAQPTVCVEIVVLCRRGTCDWGAESKAEVSICSGQQGGAPHHMHPQAPMASAGEARKMCSHPSHLEVRTALT